MRSPILELMASYGIDPAYIIIGLTAIILVMIILYVFMLRKIKKMCSNYDKFMCGNDAQSLEETILKQLERLDKLEESDQEKEEQIEHIFENLQTVYQKRGLVKYDAFREMSGKLSYALALLDKNNDGIMINSMYSREGCYSYVKDIINGESSINMSEEEKGALNIAIKGDKNVE